MKQYKCGLLIGRFQPFHLGHVYLIKKGLEVCESIIIGVGSSNKNDSENPYSFEQRKKMLERFVHEENLSEKIKDIIAIEDDPDDEKWFEMTKSAAQMFDVVISNNSWVTGIMQQQKITVISFPYFKREILEGWRIRKLMTEKNKWQDRVPSYIAIAIDSLKR